MDSMSTAFKRFLSTKQVYNWDLHCTSCDDSCLQQLFPALHNTIIACFFLDLSIVFCTAGEKISSCYINECQLNVEKIILLNLSENKNMQESFLIWHSQYKLHWPLRNVLYWTQTPQKIKMAKKLFCSSLWREVTEDEIRVCSLCFPHHHIHVHDMVCLLVCSYHSVITASGEWLEKKKFDAAFCFCSVGFHTDERSQVCNTILWCVQFNFNMSFLICLHQYLGIHTFTVSYSMSCQQKS